MKRFLFLAACLSFWFSYAAWCDADPLDNWHTKYSQLTPPNNCAATVSQDLSIHVPIAMYNGQPYSGDFQWDGGRGVTLTNVNLLNDTSAFSSCSPAIVDSDLSIHIPVIMYGDISYWAELQYAHDLLFMLIGAGQN